MQENNKKNFLPQSGTFRSIFIGDDIEVLVIDIRGNKVRLGINAPRNIPVHRKEVFQAIRREFKESIIAAGLQS